MTVKGVQERLGHANPTMTLDRYWHSRTDDEARAYKSPLRLAESRTT